MIELRVLGSTSLKNKDGSFNHSFLKGSKRLAILTFLLLAEPREFKRRDMLVSYFWPETSQKKSRNALSNILYQIRSSLGDNIIINRGTEEISINNDKVWCDAIHFDINLQKGDVEEALKHYQGDLLSGFHVKNVSNKFQTWLDNERERLRKLASNASWEMSDIEIQRSDYFAAKAWGKKAVVFNNYSEDDAIKFLELLKRLGDRSSALAFVKEFDTQLSEKWDLKPSREFSELAEEIRSNKNLVPYQKSHDKNGNILDKSVAVLPFESSGTNNATTFTNGIHGDILTKLSNISDLRVTSRTSVRKYVNSTKNLKTIGKELNVNWIVEGDVYDNNNTVQINVRLVNVPNDTQKWGENYQLKLTAKNLFKTQNKITKEIADALQTKLTTKEKNQLAIKPTKSISAYRLYAQGWSWVEQRTEKGITRGLDYFQQAIAEDPDFSLASVGCALALLALYGYGFEKNKDLLDQADEFINTALKQEPELAEAHAALGLLQTERHQGPQAIKSLRKAIQLRPGYANAHNKLSWLFQLLGKKREALSSAKEAVKLDPFSPEAVVNLAFSNLINNNKTEALKQIHKVRRLHPTWTTAIFYQAIILFHMEKYSEADKLIENLTVKWTGEGPLALRALINLEKGNESAAMKIMNSGNLKNDFFSTGLIQLARKKNENAVKAFKRIENWDAWPTLSTHHLFPEYFSGIKKEKCFNPVIHNLKKNWGML